MLVANILKEMAKNQKGYLIDKGGKLINKRTGMLGA
jgi:hypothetical protein